MTQQNRLACTLVAVSAAWLGMSAAAQHAPGFRNNLMPVPALLQSAPGSLKLTSNFTVVLSQADTPRLRAAVERTLRRLEDTAGIPISRQIVHGGTATMILDVASDGSAVQSLEEDESYSLTSTPTSVHIQAGTTLGALHAMETLLQLVQPEGTGYAIPSLTIQDQPRFHWRGLMIDCGRHFEPLPVLERNIDAMAAVKLNVFHWHLTEDQGFRIESKRFPKLTQLGSDDLFYTQEDARALVAYARDRGIRVVPEFEMPGHSTAWLVAYPELASGTTPTGIRREFGVSDYVLDPTREETYTFISSFLTEMATLFPDQYVHIGGDEAPAPDWKTNPRILAFMKVHNLHDNDGLQAYFNQRVLRILTGLNKRMVGWDEVLNPALPKDVVIQSWRGVASLATAAQEGYQGVLSAPYYLDGMRPASVHYLADPVPADTKLPPEQQKLILGGEVCMWGEQLDQRTIDSRIWPRTAAIAERFWSGQNIRDVEDMYRRLEPVSLELETLGIHDLSSEDTELRELAGNGNIQALHIFAQAFEPVGFGERYQQQHTSQLTPLTSFVDAVRPDPPMRYRMERATQQFLTDPKQRTGAAASARATLLEIFREEAASVPPVLKQMDTAPRLALMQQRAQQLAVLAAIGQQAVQYVSTGQAPPAAWVQSSHQAIEAAKKSDAMVHFTFVDPLTELVNAASH
ncbi:MAG: beta-N-acetylhexosaminidase [Janthinobacterium lividum]